MLPYAAYLRTYQPLTAFPEPERSVWASYVGSESRPSRAAALDVEHEHALRHVVAIPPIVAPERESTDAYVRRAEGVIYICPWQIRLRSWLALKEFRSSLPEEIADAFVSAPAAQQAAAEFERHKREYSIEQPHILTSTWHVPLHWFVPFDPAERWLVLGDRAGPAGGDNGPATAAPTRTLVYVTSMAQARRRVARAIAVIRRRLGEGEAYAGVESVGRYLEEFHPHSLVELDYGGLVHTRRRSVAGGPVRGRRRRVAGGTRSGPHRCRVGRLRPAGNALAPHRAPRVRELTGADRGFRPAIRDQFPISPAIRRNVSLQSRIVIMLARSLPSICSRRATRHDCSYSRK